MAMAMACKKSMRALGARAALIPLCWLAASCAPAASVGGRPVSSTTRKAAQEVVTQAELQEQLQRFSGQLMDQISEAMEPLTATPSLRLVAHRQSLRYFSAVLDIVTSPFPEVNVLDFLVFMRVNRDVIKRHWTPNVFHDAGTELEAVFTRGESEVWLIARPLLNASQREALVRLIAEWQDEHRDQVRVESVRLMDFAEQAGQVVAERDQQARGLLAGVRRATQAADRTVLFGERAMFLAHRAPFLMRLQARVGLEEVAGDLGADLERAGGKAAIGLDSAASLTEELGRTVREVRLLTEGVKDLWAQRRDGQAQGAGAGIERLHRALDSALELTEEARALLTDLRTNAPRTDVVSALVTQLDGAVQRWIRQLAVAASLITLLFWGGYVAAKRLSR